MDTWGISPDGNKWLGSQLTPSAGEPTAARIRSMPSVVEPYRKGCGSRLYLIDGDGKIKAEQAVFYLAQD